MATTHEALKDSVLDARNKLAAARIELELAIEGIRAEPSDVAQLELTVAVDRVVETECGLAVAEERLAVFEKGLAS